VTRPSRLSWSRLFEEFYCRECGWQEAYRSRPRSFLERRVLPFLLLQAVRCERCYHRVYVLRTVPALERLQPARKLSESETPGGSKPDRRVA
jgi:DNA-directed RNA polymerase subunit RPC12/RpoP